MYLNPLHVYVPPSESLTLSIVNVPFRNALILPADLECSSWPVLSYHLINVVSFCRVQWKVCLLPISTTIFSVSRTSLSSTITNTAPAQTGRPGEGTFGISGWGCAAGTLQPLALYQS